MSRRSPSLRPISSLAPERVSPGVASAPAVVATPQQVEVIVPSTATASQTSKAIAEAAVAAQAIGNTTGVTPPVVVENVVPTIGYEKMTPRQLEPNQLEWLWVLIAFVLATIIAYVILWIINPIMTQQRDLAGRPTGEINQAILIVSAIAIGLLVALIVWLCRRYI